MVEWYYNYITHRNIYTESEEGEKVRGTITEGFPQGGVCSAKFWIIAFNQALNIINNDVTKGYGFADNLCILAGGQNLNHLKVEVQHTLNQTKTKQ